MDNLTLTTAPVASSQLSSLVNAIAHVCNALVDAFEIGFDKVSSYGIKSIQHVFTGVKTLFVDVIILGLRQIEIMIKELKKYGSDEGYSQDYIQSLILLQKSQMMNRLEHHNFFRENFAWRVNEIFGS